MVNSEPLLTTVYWSPFNKYVSFFVTMNWPSTTKATKWEFKKITRSCWGVPLHSAYLNNAFFYLYVAFLSVVLVTTWLLSLMLVLLERERHVKKAVTSRHGIVLLLIWVFSFVAVNVPFTNWYGDDWWWKLSRQVDVMRKNNLKWRAFPVFSYLWIMKLRVYS